MAVHIGNGDGTFRTGESYTLQANEITNVTLVDVNKDGLLDVATSGRTDATDAHLIVSLGRGDGTFSTAFSYVAAAASQQYWNTEGEDINNDGNIDLVSTGRLDGATSGFANIFIGDGNGTFANPLSIGLNSQQTYDARLVDINGDSVIDLLTVGVSVTGKFSISLGNGNGTFQAATTIDTVGTAAINLQIKDVNQDGKLDAIIGGRNSSSDGEFRVPLGNGDGTFQVATSYSMQLHAIDGMRVADIDGNGTLDVVASGYDDSGNGYLFTRLGSGNGNFGAANSYTTSETNGNYGVDVGDFNSDGVLDVVTGGRTDSAQGTVSVYLHQTQEGVATLIDFSLKSQASALQALGLFNNKLTQLSLQQSSVGTTQSRLEIASSLITSTRELSYNAESRIRDADIAEESSKLLQSQILAQSASQILRSASLDPKRLVSLLLN